MPFLAVGDINIYFEEKGSGKPVLFISGTGADLRVKPNVLDGPLPNQRRVVAFDQRGLGQTDKPDEPYSMSQYAGDAAGVLRGRDILQADVVGVSFGGMVALHLALNCPDLVTKLVLCCTSPGGRYASSPFHDLPDDLTAEERMLKLMPVNDVRRDENWQRDNPDVVAGMFAYARDHAVEEHSTEHFRRGARRQLEARAGHDVEARLGEIKAPTLICAGKYDGIAPAENQDALLEGIQRSELKWYEGGHLFLIQDKQAWPDIIEFLD
jgi:3-oxoadipate enol-lactonase